jgi:hypothetical protein
MKPVEIFLRMGGERRRKNDRINLRCILNTHVNITM